MDDAHVYFLGIDVGTGSARAGLFTPEGRLAGMGIHPIQMWKPAPDFVEQSSEDIWKACGKAVRMALEAASAVPGQVKGIGFDATCSLVVLDAADKSVTASPTGRDEQNVIVWMDHRAVNEALLINRLNHDVLHYVGGAVSPEMQSPKLRWLKTHLPESWKRAARFLDLPDFLTYKATGDDTRSLCTTVCKWTYLAQLAADKKDERAGWVDSFWQPIGLGEFVREKYARIGTRIRPMGEPLGNGLTASAAKDLGLAAGTPVGAGMIDAHAGGIGVLGASAGGDRKLTPRALQERLALIIGTSSCHLAVSPEPRFVPGVWGPYLSAMIPGMWLTEGGQSATGALLDHLVNSHAASAGLEVDAKKEGVSLFELLNRRIEVLASTQKLPCTAALTRDLHVFPDFHGNRSPRADPFLRGAIVGLPLSATVDDLALVYYAAVQAIAYGTRHIVEALNEKGYKINTILACGGGTKNPLILREHADATGCRILLPREPEAVLLGSAILGAVAAKSKPGIIEAMAAMSEAGDVLRPTGGATKAYHEAKYRVFHRLHDDQVACRAIMAPKRKL